MGIVVAAVVVVVLTVVSVGWFAPVGSAILGSLTGAGSAAFATGTAAVAATTLGAAIVGGGIGFASGFLSTFIATGGNFGQAFSAGIAGGVVGFATGLLSVAGIGQIFSGAVKTLVSNAGYYLTDVGTAILNTATTAVQAAAQGFENGMLGSLSQEITTGHVSGTGLFRQWGLSGLLAAATAVVAFDIGHIIPWNNIGGPTVNTNLTQEVTGYTANGQPIFQPMTVGELLVKPALEGLAEYGVASAFGVKDAEALGIGATAGAYFAPFAINATRDLLGSSDQTVSLFQLGNTGYNSYVTNSVSGQLTNIVGGIASSIYDGNYQMGAYGANQVFTYNDIHVTWTDKNGKVHQYVYVDGNPDVYVTLNLGDNGQILDTLQLMKSEPSYGSSDFQSLYNQWVNNYARATGNADPFGNKAALDTGDIALSGNLDGVAINPNTLSTFQSALQQEIALANVPAQAVKSVDDVLSQNGLPPVSAILTETGVGAPLVLVLKLAESASVTTAEIDAASIDNAPLSQQSQQALSQSTVDESLVPDNLAPPENAGQEVPAIDTAQNPVLNGGYHSSVQPTGPPDVLPLDSATTTLTSSAVSDPPIPHLDDVQQFAAQLQASWPGDIQVLKTSSAPIAVADAPATPVTNLSQSVIAPESGAFDVTARLSQHLDNALDMFNAKGFTDPQQLALADNPGLEAAFRGSQIDTYFKQYVAEDPDLADLQLTPRFKFGPDVFDPATQQWWDVTTPAQWQQHVEKYWLFGDGTPLFTK